MTIWNLIISQKEVSHLGVVIEGVRREANNFVGGQFQDRQVGQIPEGRLRYPFDVVVRQVQRLEAFGRWKRLAFQRELVIGQVQDEQRFEWRKHVQI